MSHISHIFSWNHCALAGKMNNSSSARPFTTSINSHAALTRVVCRSNAALANMINRRALCKCRNCLMTWYQLCSTVPGLPPAHRSVGGAAEKAEKPNLRERRANTVVLFAPQNAWLNRSGSRFCHQMAKGGGALRGSVAELRVNNGRRASVQGGATVTVVLMEGHFCTWKADATKPLLA